MFLVIFQLLKEQRLIIRYTYILHSAPTNNAHQDKYLISNLHYNQARAQLIPEIFQVLSRKTVKFRHSLLQFPAISFEKHTHYLQLCSQPLTGGHSRLWHRVVDYIPQSGTKNLAIESLNFSVSTIKTTIKRLSHTDDNDLSKNRTFMKPKNVTLIFSRTLSCLLFWVQWKI